MKTFKYSIISVTASTNGSRRFFKEVYDKETAMKYAIKRKQNKNVFYIKIYEYEINKSMTNCKIIYEYDKFKLKDKVYIRNFNK